MRQNNLTYTSSHRRSFSWPVVLVFVLLRLESSSHGAVYYRYTRIHDIGSPIRAGQPTWGLSNGLKGTFFNKTSKIVKMSTHMGTHVDSPAHAYQQMFKGHDVAALDLRTLNGPVLVVDVPGKKNITGCHPFGGTGFERYCCWRIRTAMLTYEDPRRRWSPDEMCPS
ncbi:hypothetical protein F511_34690 [Dorcoceras hygrometricum]|uniref:Cyclase family protein n=1 Tax=Dorcoceras hygrometricum TaxID=472368 RepID=A0A2Z7DAM9_9LAMI|nr:hypothetical protein F511_34690 [Dorcoceras hygrometricum]